MIDDIATLDKLNKMIIENIRLTEENENLKERIIEYKMEIKMLRDELDKIYTEMIEKYFTPPKFILDKLRGTSEERDN